MHVVQDLITVHFYDSVPKTRGCQQFLSYFLLLLCSQHFFPSPNAPNVAGKADVILTTVPQGILKFYFPYWICAHQRESIWNSDQLVLGEVTASELF